LDGMFPDTLRETPVASTNFPGKAPMVWKPYTKRPAYEKIF
jgi:hypothetical protein